MMIYYLAINYLRFGVQSYEKAREKPNIFEFFRMQVTSAKPKLGIFTLILQLFCNFVCHFMENP